MTDLAWLEVEDRGSLCLIRVQGEVDTSNAHQLFASIQAAVPDAAATLALDLTHTRYLDSAGIRLLFLLVQRCQVRRTELRLIVPEGAPIRSVLELTGLPKVIPLEREVDGTPPTGDR
jgi:anti-anti-sigma factor